MNHHKDRWGVSWQSKGGEEAKRASTAEWRNKLAKIAGRSCIVGEALRHLSNISHHP